MSRLGAIATVLAVLMGGSAVIHAALADAAARREANTKLSALRYSRAKQADLAGFAIQPVTSVATDTTPLAQRVSDCLSASGLPASVMQSLSPDSPSETERVQRRRAALTLHQLTLPQLGRFLGSWRERHGHWAVTSVDLSPDESAKANPGSDRPVRVVLVLESLTIAEGAQ